MHTTYPQNLTDQEQCGTQQVGQRTAAWGGYGSYSQLLTWEGI